jgi:hypothetical protein
MHSLPAVIFLFGNFFPPCRPPQFVNVTVSVCDNVVPIIGIMILRGKRGGGVVGLWVLMWHDATDCGLSCDKRLTLFRSPLYTSMLTSLAVKCSTHRNGESAAVRRTAVSRITIMMTFCECVADNLSFQLVDRDIN